MTTIPQGARRWGRKSAFGILYVESRERLDRFLKPDNRKAACVFWPHRNTCPYSMLCSPARHPTCVHYSQENGSFVHHLGEDLYGLSDVDEVHHGTTLRHRFHGMG
jgi:hypothetical protein